VLKKIIKPLLLFVVAFALGYLLACVNLYRSVETLVAHFQNIGLREMAIDVYQLQSGDADAVLKRKMGALPIITQQFDSAYRKRLPAAESQETLWAVSRCYEAPGTEVPTSIKPILDALPPRPPTSCELKENSDNGE
jgi:hypothetical protein